MAFFDEIFSQLSLNDEFPKKFMPYMVKLTMMGWEVW